MYGECSYTDEKDFYLILGYEAPPMSAVGGPGDDAAEVVVVVGVCGGISPYGIGVPVDKR